ncbi:MAG: hypothetical protein JSU86_05630, partial [Phycisphaerales bacterium]
MPTTRRMEGVARPPLATWKWASPGVVVAALMMAAGAAATAQTIDVTPDSGTVFAFSGFEGGPFVADTPTTWTVRDADGVGLDFSVLSDKAWLRPDPAGGTLPPTFLDPTVEISASLDGRETAGLAPGVHSATVSFINLENGAGDTARTVTLTVAPASFSVSPAFVNAHAVQNGPSPAPVTVTLASNGQTDLNYTLSWVARSWFTLDKTGGTVPAGGTDTFTVLFNPFGLGPGTYTARLTVVNTTNGAGTASLPITLTVSSSAAGAVRLLPDADIEVAGPEGELDLPAGGQESVLINSSDRFVLWSAAASDNWVSVMPSGGELAPDDRTSRGPDEQSIVVRANLAANDLPAGSHTATVTFENETTGVPIGTRLVRALVDPVLTLTAGLVGGEITASPNGIAVAEEQSNRLVFDFGEVVMLTAVVHDGYQFEGWASDVPPDSPQDNPIVIVLDSSRTISAAFVPITHTLTLSASGTGTGTTRPTPTGVFVDNALVSRYYDGAEVTLEAEADAGSTFVGWAGNVPFGEEQNNPLVVLMDRDRTITARFEPVVTLQVNVLGGGEVSVEPDLDVYPSGAEVTLSAVPDEAFVFTGWGGDATGVVPVLTIVLDGDKDIEAVFGPEGQDNGNGDDVDVVALVLETVGDGQVSPTAREFEVGAMVTLVATPAVGSVFARWEGDASGTDLTITVLMDRDRTVRAVFEEDPSAT